jgi:hypothetical protein
MKLIKKISLPYLLQIFVVIILFSYVAPYSGNDKEVPVSNNAFSLQTKKAAVNINADSILNDKANSFNKNLFILKPGN